MHKHIPILIVEDNEDERFFLLKALSQIGRERQVQFLASGLELIGYLQDLPQHQQPALIVLDYNMPVMNGREVVQAIQSQVSNQQIPVIIYSSGFIPPLQQEFKDLKVLTFIEKGFDFGKVVEQVKFFTELIADDVDTLLGNYDG